MIYSDEFFMQEALKEATKAFAVNEVPIGAVIVHNNCIISRAHNLCEQICDPTAHAELIAVKSACHHLQSKYLDDCVIYVTLEPCAMCAGALFWSKINKIVYGASDKKRGISSIMHSIIHPKTIIVKNIMQIESAKLLSDFFQKKRKFDQKI